jgi:polyisoprenoid-binding protein YceI
MKKSSVVFGLLALLVSLAALTFNTKATLNVDKKASKITWKGESVTGFHAGEISVSNGSLTIENGKLTGGSFDIDMNTITCTDLKPAEGGDRLVGHLKADDFFGVAKYPTAKFVITKSTWQGGNNYKIVGNLTIKETTKEIKFNAVASGNDTKATAEATVMIDRTDYNVKYGSGSFFDGLGDKTIYDNFELKISLVAGK